LSLPGNCRRRYQRPGFRQNPTMKTAICILLLVVSAATACYINTIEETVPISQGCVKNGKTYDDGALTDDPCDRCTCYNGLELCYEEPCDSSEEYF
jgi:hypothetical protein